jgi:hypothetical protein
MSVRIVDGGVILVCNGIYENIYLKPGTITGFSGPSIIYGFEVYTADNRVIKIRAKKEDVEDIKHSLSMVLTTIPSYPELVKVFSDLRSQLEADLLYTNQRIDMIYEDTKKSTSLEETVSECSTELESLNEISDIGENEIDLKKEEDYTTVINDFMNHIFIMIITVIIVYAIYTINMH